MKIIIVGAGRIGKNLAISLAEEDHEVYLIEKNEQKASKIKEKLDAKVIVGSGADPDILLKADVSNADLVLAVTTSDETNLVVCSLAGSFGTKRRIARVRNTALSNTLSEFGYNKFYLDEIINPEVVAAEAIVQTIQTPGASEVAEFAKGKILLRGIDVPGDSPLCGFKIEEFRDEDFPWPFLIVSIVRSGKVSIPKGDTVVEPGDHIYVLLPEKSMGEFLTYVDPNISMPKKVIIYGATITGRHTASVLAEKLKEVILLEEDEEKAREIAGELESVRVINGSASESEILTECGIEAADTFIATSNNENANLISSVLAKRMGAKTTIITTQQPEYVSLVDALGIDAIINPHHLAVEQILRQVRGRGISSVTKLMECEAEALELIPEPGAAITRDILRNIKIPKNSIVGAVYRDSDVVLADGNTMIRDGEKVIAFCQESSIKKLQDLFTKK